jgi:hypothetical protein
MAPARDKRKNSYRQGEKSNEATQGIAGSWGVWEKESGGSAPDQGRGSH